MTTQERKAQKQELVDTLLKARATHEVATVIALLRINLEDAKDKLITLSGDDLLRGQGDARTYDGLLRMLTQPRAVIVSKEQPGA